MYHTVVIDHPLTDAGWKASAIDEARVPHLVVASPPAGFPLIDTFGAVAWTVREELMRAALQPVQGALAEDGIIPDAEPLAERAAGCHDDAGPAVSRDDEFVQVARLPRAQAIRAEVIDDPQGGYEVNAEGLRRHAFTSSPVELAPEAFGSSTFGRAARCAIRCAGRPRRAATPSRRHKAVRSTGGRGTQPI